LESYEKILASIVVVGAFAFLGWWFYMMYQQSRQPVTVKWIYGTDGRFEGVMIT
jgi:hypothetical protein